MGESAQAAQLIHQYGYPGLALALMVNCMGVPISSEVLLPLTGALSRSGELNLVTAATVVVTAQVAGLSLSYGLARKGGYALLERYGKYAFLNHKHLHKLDKLFQRHGARIVFAGQYLPGVHGYMGYVAGLGGLPIWLFLLLTISSTVVWTAGFMGLGMVLSENLGLITQVASGTGMFVVLLIILGGLGIWYSRHHAK